MEYWEFLLQKEGDRSWLPLESPNVEILEGRYRVVARSSRVRTPVEVRVIHDATKEVPPKRRVQKRAGHTNPDGLIVVIPFTRLQPGRWELRCTSDLMADMMGESWEYAVQLQVIYSDPDIVDDWEPDWERTASEAIALKSAMASERFASESILQVEESAPALEQPVLANTAATDVTEATATDVTAAGTVLAEELAATETVSAEDPSKTEIAELATVQPTIPPVVPPTAQPGEQSKESVTPEALLEAVPETDRHALNPQREAGLADIHAANSLEETGLDELISQSTDTQSLTGATAALADSLVDAIAPSDAAPDVEVSQPLANALSASISTSSVFQMAEEQSKQVVDAAFEDFDLDQSIDQAVESILKEFMPNVPAQIKAGDRHTDESDSSLDTPPPAESTASAATPQLQVTLEREAYVVRRGRSFSLVGRVALLDPQSQVMPAVRVSKIQIRMHDPKTNQVVAEVHQPLADKAVPFSFNCPVATPAHGQTHLFLGEVLLYAVPTVGVPTKVLATQSFTVAADMEELLEAIVTEPTPLDLQTPLAFSSPGDTDVLNLEFLELLDSPGSMVQFQPASAAVLPPQLHPSKSAGATPKPLELPLADDPTFTLSGNAEAVRQLLMAKATSESVEPVEPIEANVSEQTDTATENSLSPLASPSTATPSAAEPIPDGRLEELLPTAEHSEDRSEDFSETAGESLEKREKSVFATPAEDDLPSEPSHDLPKAPSESSASSKEKTFQSLNLRNRFWSRLNSLVTNTDSSGSLEASPAESPFVEGITLGVDADLVAQEIVVEDEPPPSRFRGERWPRRAKSDLTPLSLPEEEPVPTPQIELPLGELIAGESVNVMVKLPDVTSRLYVKLWLHDRQTRSLLEGPHWLMNFLPNGSGEQEVRTQLIVPFGCFEIQFEAIAVEMATQRESHKIIVDRMIIPPDLPTLLLDELDV
jgi:hypothetical protein